MKAGWERYQIFSLMFSQEIAQKLTRKCRQICWFLLKWFQNLALEILCIIAVLVIVSKDRIKLNEL